jgi:glycerol-3-phosphate cytidylyltransferase
MKVFTTGTFDVLHYGHINLLKKAKELGDYLIVGLNVTKNGKPTYYSYEERKKVLEAISYVNEVVPIYEQSDKYKYLDQVDIFAIGSDYIGFPDIEDIRKHCKVIFIQRTPGISSTQVKQYLSDKTKYHSFVIDIDDTICTTYDRDFENSVPNEKVIEKINELYDKGWKIILYTARGGKSCKTLEEKEKKYKEVTEKWLKKNNVRYSELQFGKMNADYYVDDKNLSINEFLNFKGE